MNEENKIREMLEAQMKKMKDRKEYILANIDEFRLAELEYIDSEELPGIFWKIFAIPVDSDPTDKHIGKEHEPYVRLEWGWSAGLTEEKLATLAEDSPKGKDFLYTSLRSIKELRDDLTSILDKYNVVFEE